jgi:hypothetical protein
LKRKKPHKANKNAPNPTPGSPLQKGTIGQTTKPKRSLRQKFFSVIWDGLGLLGAITTIWIAVWLHVYVYPSEALDPNNPVFTPFIVRNDGYLAIRDVKFSCAIKYLTRTGGPTVIALGKYDNRFSDPKQVSRIITPGEEASEILPLSGMKHNLWENEDIAVRLEFRPWRWLPFYERQELHRFEVKRKGDHWHWFPQPINK